MTKQQILRFERQTCSRCGGSGKHSFCEQYRDTCFKCGGSGEQLTKRGIAASERLAELLTHSIEDIKPGDQIRRGKNWFTVEGIEQDIDQGHGRIIDGKTIWARGVEFTSIKGFKLLAEYGSTLKLKATDEDRASCADYQDTLTKAGTPRKRR